MSSIHLDPADFSPLIESAVDAAIRRLEGNRPRDAAGRILLAKAEAAEAMGVSVTTVDRWRESHGLPCLKLQNGKPMFRPEALRKWAKQQEGRAT